MAPIITKIGSFLVSTFASWGLLEWVQGYFQSETEEEAPNGTYSLFHKLLIGVMGVVILLMGYFLIKKSR